MPTGGDEVARVVGAAADLRDHVVSRVGPICATRQAKLTLVAVTFDNRSAESRPRGAVTTFACVGSMVVALSFAEQVSATRARVQRHSLRGADILRRVVPQNRAFSLGPDAKAVDVLRLGVGIFIDQLVQIPHVRVPGLRCPLDRSGERHYHCDGRVDLVRTVRRLFRELVTCARPA